MNKYIFTMDPSDLFFPPNNLKIIKAIYHFQKATTKGNNKIHS